MKQTKFNLLNHHRHMRPSARGVEIIFLLFHNAFVSLLSQQKCNENALRLTDRKRQFVGYEHDRSTVLFLPSMVGSRRIFFFGDNFSILCLCWTGIVEISSVFLSLSSKINALFRQDLYDRKRYIFWPHAATINTKWKFLGGASNKYLK